MTDKRADDLNKDSSLPQPGTEEPKDPESSDSTEGPGNVSVEGVRSMTNLLLGRRFDHPAWRELWQDDGDVKTWAGLR